jgi:hypothetical protein
VKVLVIIAFVLLGLAAIQMKFLPRFSSDHPAMTFVLYLSVVILQIVANIYIFFVDK